MTHREELDALSRIVGRDTSREERAARIAETIRAAGSYRWVGLYDVQDAVVSNIAWSGPGAPVHPTFPSTNGLTSRAIAGKCTVNVGDVAGDSDYLDALGDTRSEIIVPVLVGDRVVGTIDVESEKLNAFQPTAQLFLEECAGRLAASWGEGRM
jgi:putative methionine-R-sulfoxide reductase with GAF domain